MKMIMAVIKPFTLDAVRAALVTEGIEGLTVTEVKGFGRQKGETEIYRGTEIAVSYVPKIKLEIAVEDNQVETVVNVINKNADTGRIGDGRIFVYDLLSVTRIGLPERTAEE